MRSCRQNRAGFNDRTVRRPPPIPKTSKGKRRVVRHAKMEGSFQPAHLFPFIQPRSYSTHNELGTEFVVRRVTVVGLLTSRRNLAVPLSAVQLELPTSEDQHQFQSSWRRLLGVSLVRASMLPRRGRTALLSPGGFRLGSCQRYALSLGPSSPPVEHHGRPGLASNPEVGFSGVFGGYCGSFCRFRSSA